jgi:hypothetical protein
MRRILFIVIAIGVAYNAYPEHTTLCYGVNAAAKVRIEPELPNIYPALSNCVDIAPTQTTTYKIIAEDKAGKSVDAQLEINVRR